MTARTARSLVLAAVVALAAVIGLAGLGLSGWLDLLGAGLACFAVGLLVSSPEFAQWRERGSTVRAEPRPLARVASGAGVGRPGGGSVGLLAPPPTPPSPWPTYERPSPGDGWDPDGDPADDRPRSQHSYGSVDLGEVATALAAALALAWIARTVLGWGGIAGTAIWCYLLFLGIYALVLRDRTSPETAVDRLVTVVIWSIAATVVGILGWMLTFLLVKGLPGLDAGFFTHDMSEVGPLTPGGGALHAIIGTVEQVGIATVVVVPIAVLTAVYLHELHGRMAKVIRFVVDAMSGLPSIVAGLLVFTVWVNGRGYSGIAGSAALAILMLPTVTRASEEILRTIPDTFREASLALGAPQWRVVLRVIVPTAMTGLVTATILGVARAVGETAPMLLTAFGSDSTVMSPVGHPQDDLPLFIWKLILLPNATQQQRAWTGALILVLLVLVLFVSARLLAARARNRLGRAR